MSLARVLPGGLDGAWAVMVAPGVLAEYGYEPSPYGPRGWWVSPAVALASRRLGHLPLSEDIAGFLDGGDPLGPRLVQESPPVGTEHLPGGVFGLTGRRERVRSQSRWNACVALLAHVHVDDTELVALATFLHATGRVEAL